MKLMRVMRVRELERVVRQARHTSRHPRGAALVAVLLLTMILSAIGVVAMQNTFYSMQLSGNYRMRRQAAETADAALTFVSVRAGDRPVNYMGRMRAEQSQELVNAQTIERGGVAKFSRNDFQSAAIVTNTGNETGFFQGPDANNLSHESDASLGEVTFDVVMRDPSNGPPPPGSDNSFCSKKVYIGSRATYDALDRVAGQVMERNWSKPPRAAASMVGLEAWIGPIPCQGGGSR